MLGLVSFDASCALRMTLGQNAAGVLLGIPINFKSTNLTHGSPWSHVSRASSGFSPMDCCESGDHFWVGTPGGWKKINRERQFRRWVIVLGAGHPVVGFLAGNYDKRRCDSGGGSDASVSCCATLLGSAGSPWSGFIAKIS